MGFLTNFFRTSPTHQIVIRARFIESKNNTEDNITKLASNIEDIMQYICTSNGFDNYDFQKSTTKYKNGEVILVQEVVFPPGINLNDKKQDIETKCKVCPKNSNETFELSRIITVDVREVSPEQSNDLGR